MNYKRNLTSGQIIGAFVVAAFVDLAQLLLDAGFILTIETVVGPIGMEGADLVLDVFAGVVLSILLGFHVAFLPTALVEAIPIVDAIPTWTVAAGYVVYRRKQELLEG